MSVLDAAAELELDTILAPLETADAKLRESGELHGHSTVGPVNSSSQIAAGDIELAEFPIMEKRDLTEQELTTESAEATAVASAAHLYGRREILYLATCYWGSFTIGWNDGSTGPLILRMEEYYNVGYAVVSLLFVSAFVGFALSAVLTVPLTDRFGFGKVIVLGAVCQIIAYSVQSAAPPFPLFVCAFAINGFGVAIMGAQVNAFVACLPSAGWKLQLLHAGYGVGAFISPLAATRFAEMQHWSFQYLIAACLSLLEVVLYGVVFRFRTQPDLLNTPLHPHPAHQNKYRQILRLRTVHLLSFFILVYVGLEVSIGGWIVTYIVQIRGGEASAGYIASGFWGGLALGRLTLIWVNEKLGVKRVIFLYLGLALALEFIVWFVPSIIGDAVAISAVGLFLGPFYPLVVGAGQKVFPAWLLTGCIGWIASFGQAGSAVFPFLTGALAQKFGITVLQPLLVAMIITEGVIWAFVPLTDRRAD